MSSTSDLSEVVQQIQELLNEKLKPSADTLERFIKLSEVIDLENGFFLRSLSRFESDNQALVNQLLDSLGLASVDGETIVSRSVITNLGVSRLNTATAINKITIKKILVGDGNGSSYIITGAETSLKNVKTEGLSSNPISDSNRPNVLYFDFSIPASVGGFTIREVGIIDDFDQLFALGVTSVVTLPDPLQNNGNVKHIRISIELPTLNDVTKFNFQNPAFPHNTLGSRDSENAHPLSSISGGKEFRDEVYQGVIYPIKPELVADITGQNEIPVGTTLIRLSVGSSGQTAVYAMQPPINGQITSIKRFANEPFAIVAGGVEAALFNPLIKNAPDLKSVSAMKNINKSLINVLNYFSNSDRMPQVKQYLWSPTETVSAHDGVTAVAKAALQSWNGLASGLSSMLGWSGTGNGVFYNVNAFANAKKVSDFISDGNDQTACNYGWKSLSKVVKDGDIILVDGTYLAGNGGSELRIANKVGVNIVGGIIKKVPGSAEYPIWIDTCQDTTLTGVFLKGKDTVLPVWGSQGLYLRNSVRTIVNGCHFSDAGDAAIRFARSTTTFAEVASFGVLIVNCTFKNCNQITSNNTGASDVIFANNYIDGHSTFKVTQRTEIVPAATLVFGNIYRNADKVTEVQGARGVYVFNNVGTTKQLAGVYPNTYTFFGKSPISTDVYFIDNNLEFTHPDNFILYSEVREDLGGGPIIQDGDIVIKGNIFKTKTPRTAYTLRFVHYTEEKSQLFQNLIVEDNEFIGSFRDFVSVGGDTSFDLSHGELVSICGNKGGTFTESWVTIRTKVYNTGQRPNIYVCGNKRMTVYKPLEIGYAYRDIPDGNQTIPNEFFYDDNDLTLTYGGTLFYDGSKYSPGIKTSITGNKFHSTASAAVNQLWIFTPEPNVAARSIFMFRNNTLVIDPASNARPLYVNGEGTGPATQWGMLLAANNHFVRGLRGPLCDNSAYRKSGIQFGLTTGVNKSVKLISERYESNLNGVGGTWRYTRIWSDKTCKIHGWWLNAGSNSFNTYYGTTLNEVLDMQIQNLGNAGAPYLVGRYANYAVVRFNGGGNPWFSFTVEGKITDAQVDQYIMDNNIY